MSHKKLRPFIVKVSVLGYFPLYILLLLLLSDVGTSTWVIVEALMLVETITLNLTC